jgi:hypothetical protein
MGGRDFSLRGSTHCVCGISEQKDPTLVPTALWWQLVDGIDLPAVTLGDDGLEAFDAAVGVNP